MPVDVFQKIAKLCSNTCGNYNSAKLFSFFCFAMLTTIITEMLTVGGCLEAELISTTLLVHCLAVSCWVPFYIFRFFNVSVGAEISTLKSNFRGKFARHDCL